MLRLALTFLVPAALVAGCADDGADPAASGTPPPPQDSGVDPTGGSGSGTTAGLASGTTAAETGALAVCAQCGADEFCAADHVAGAVSPDSLDFSCRETCVAVGDTSVWCGDDAACCEGLCDAFGRCGADALDGGPTSGSTTGAGSGTTAATGTTAAGSGTDTSGSSSGGSSSGGSSSGGSSSGDSSSGGSSGGSSSTG